MNPFLFGALSFTEDDTVLLPETNTVLKPHLDWRLKVTWQILDYPPLKAYNPVFHNHFVDFFAKMIREDVGQYFNQARYVWYKVEGNTLILYFK